MKKYIVFAIASLYVFFSNAQHDDLYFVPRKKNTKVTTSSSPVIEKAEEVKGTPQLTSFSSIGKDDETELSDGIANIRRIMNTDASHMKHLSEPVKGVYAIKNISIPHFNISTMVDVDMLAYSSSLTPGHPTKPYYSYYVEVSQQEIVVFLEERDIFLANVGLGRPKDPFKPVWNCMDSKTVFEMPIVLENGVTIPCKISYSCLHEAVEMPRGVQAVGDDGSIADHELAKNIKQQRRNSKRSSGGAKDYYPPINFSHCQIVSFSIPQIASAMNMTTKEAAAMIALYGISRMPLNKDVFIWELEKLERDLISYALVKLYDLDENYLASFEASMVEKQTNRISSTQDIGKRLSDIKINKTTKGSDIRAIAVDVANESHKTALIMPEDNPGKYNMMLTYCNAKAMEAVSYALDKNTDMMNEKIREAMLFVDKDPYFFLFFMSLTDYLYDAEIYYPAVFYGIQMFGKLSEKPNKQDFFHSDRRRVQMFLTENLIKFIQSCTKVALTRDKTAYEKGLEVFQICKKKDMASVVEIKPLTQMSICELSFYYSVSQMLEILSKNTIDKQHIYDYESEYGRIVGGAIRWVGKQFYAHYSVALESYNTYCSLYRKFYGKEATEENCESIAAMNKYLKEKFIRLKDEAAFDNTMLNMNRQGAFNEETNIKMVDIY